MSDTLFGARRKRGAAEALLARTMRAWNDAGEYVGPQWAAQRGALRDLARAVDQARSDMYDGDGSAYSFARATELYRQALAAFQTAGAGGVDDIDKLLNDLADS